MEIRNFSFSFDNKKIFEDTSFSDAKNGITVILGKSGIGKSTLLNILTGELKCEEYCFSLFKREISYVKQNPDFLFDLKMKDHILFLETIFNRKLNKDLLDYFDLNKTLNSYPLSLSGGEKLRWGLVLGAFKQKKYLLCDEPTASLDWEQKRKVFNFLEDYAKNGHSVIICTHDKDALEYASKIYIIENFKLVIQKNVESEVKVDKKRKKQSHHLNDQKIIKILRRNRDYHQLMRLGIKLLFSLSIIIICLSFKLDTQLLNMNELKQYKDSDSEIMVYKRGGGKKKADLSYTGVEAQLTKEEKDVILNVEHINKITPMYQNSLYIGVSDPIHGEYEYLEDFSTSIINNGTVIYEDSYWPGYSLASYDDTKDYTKYISKKVSDEKIGIYLNKYSYLDILDRLGSENLDLGNCQIKFTFVVPVFLMTGGTTDYFNGLDLNPNLSLPVYLNSGVPIEVTLPILGVLNESKMGVIDTSSNIFISGTFFIPNSFVYDEVEKYKINEEHKMYITTNRANDSQCEYIDVLPENEDFEITRVMSLIPWEANSYLVELDDITYTKQVLGELEELGFGVISSNNIESQNPFLSYAYEHSFNVLIVFFVLVSVLVAIMVQILSKSDRKQAFNFFLNNLENKKTVKKIINMQYMIETERLIFLTFILLFMIFVYLKLTIYFYFQWRDLFIILIVVGFSFIYEFLLAKMAGGNLDD